MKFPAKLLVALSFCLVLAAAHATTAVVFSESTGRYGVAWNEPGKDAALKKAVEDCRYRGGSKDCNPVRVTDEQGFGVVATICAGNICGLSVITGRRSARQAEADALKDCNAYYKTRDCRIYDNWEERGSAAADYGKPKQDLAAAAASGGQNMPVTVAPPPPARTDKAAVARSEEPQGTPATALAVPAPQGAGSTAGDTRAALTMEAFSDLVARIPPQYLTPGSGFDYSITNRLQGKLFAQMNKYRRLVLFPDIRNRMLDNLDKAIVAADPASSNFDQEMSYYGGYRHEPGRDVARAAQWYEKVLNTPTCNDAGESKNYPCDVAESSARARLAVLCIGGHACTSDVGPDKEKWRAKGLSLIYPRIKAIDAWFRSSARPDDPLLNEIHQLAIFLPPEVQLKLARIRAEKILDLYQKAGLVRPFPADLVRWGRRSMLDAAPRTEILPKVDLQCFSEGIPYGSDAWNTFVGRFEKIAPLNAMGRWPTWLALAANGGNQAAIAELQKAKDGGLRDMELKDVASFTARWETTMAQKMAKWRKELSPGMIVIEGSNLPYNNSLTILRTKVTKLQGDKVMIATPHSECTAVIEYRRIRDGALMRQDCTASDDRDIVKWTTRSELFPVGYDDFGWPVSSGSTQPSGAIRSKVVGGQAIPLVEEDCGYISNMQRNWPRQDN